MRPGLKLSVPVLQLQQYGALFATLAASRCRPGMTYQGRYRLAYVGTLGCFNAGGKDTGMPVARRRPVAGGTTARGLGYRHRQRVAALKRAHVPGTPCARCGLPMHDVRGLDGGHADGQERALGSGALPTRLEHATCNRRAGALFGHVLRGNVVRTPALNTSRRW